MRFNMDKLANFVMSLCAGAAAFIFTLIAFLLLREFDQQVVASLTMGLFALMIVWVASEKPNSGHARAMKALIERLLAVRAGDLTSPTPKAVKQEMPELASAVDALFEQVRSTIDDVHAMAMYDPVTSLPNRLQFKREAERALKARADGDNLALLFVDLDGFKEVNDSLGHAQGDQVLAMVAGRLSAVVKSESGAGLAIQPLVARLAGDEFTMLFPSISGPEEAERIAQATLAALTEPFENGGRIIDMGASIGVAICPRDGTDLTSLMKAADIAMYCAKSSGRSQARLYHPSLAAAFALRAPCGTATEAAPKRPQPKAVRITRA
jgi:diguanylate cyclase (GGDEF)-like protein